MISFGSDNHSGVHPEIFQSLIDANVGHAPSYGTDDYSQRALKLFEREFGKNSKSFFVFNGTAANVLSLVAMGDRFNSVICAQTSHIHNDECGAPEAVGGLKLQTIQTQNGKITSEQIEKFLIRGGDQHFSQPKIVSITQPTEYGTVYSMEEVREISQLCKKRGLLLHIDGARLINAATFLKVSLGEVVKGADVVSFGGTKNGLMFGEAVVFLNSNLADNFQYVRKQLMQLPSKSRFIGAQFERLLTNGLWQNIAQHSLAMAQELNSKLEALKVEVTQPVQSNAVFCKFPQKIIKPLREKFFFYVWNEFTFEVRLVATFDTSKEQVRDFAKHLGGLL